MGFFDQYRQHPRCPVEAALLREQGVSEDLIGPDDPGCKCALCDPTSQDRAGICQFCGLANDDVIIGVCSDCAEEEQQCSSGYCGPVYRGAS